jgi:glycosyltransferase involved in cell wall biosynthesis
MQGKVLHILSQRPSRTGSGITLDALVREAARSSWEQDAAVGTPEADAHPEVGGLPRGRIHPLAFGRGRLNFPLPGMSDVMPYRSTRFAGMNPGQIDAYLQAWLDHLQALIRSCRPDLIHTHHIWLVSALVKNAAPGIPVVNHCHATGLRQMTLCPHLADRVRAGCRRNDRFLALHADQARELAVTLDVPAHRVAVVGAGYQDSLFHDGGVGNRRENTLLYVGKYSAAKGLPWLLDAIDRLSGRKPGLVLHVAGSGAGAEADALGRRMADMDPAVVCHGQLDQGRLADLMRRCRVCVLPSFYEGLPLVLAEALACGCRLVSTRLPGVMDQLAPHFGGALELVPLPAGVGPGSNEPENPGRFVDDLAGALEKSLAAPPLESGAPEIRAMGGQFSWSAVFRRVERVWRELA